MILGTAGHIDHGKTALVRALTGVDTDRLPEEKRRGITIDLGFAPLRLPGGETIGVVDVPGHEAFVRTMLAGASGIDLALLVVAADEGPMPQTREHLSILELLRVPRLVVALTKLDLVDGDWLELVTEDVRKLLSETPYGESAIVPTSSTTGAGLDRLRACLDESTHKNSPRSPGVVSGRDGDQQFRLPIDRAFTVKGTGTVVTGTVWSGALSTDQTIRILPSGATARVRGLQNHGVPVARLAPGMRAAVALAGVDVQALHRGATLVTDAAWEPTLVLRADLTLLPQSPELRPRTRVRFHLATSDVGARVIATGSPVAPGTSRTVRVVLDESVVARAGDRFVLRSASPLATIGGGVITDPASARRARPMPALGLSAAARLELFAAEAGLHGVPHAMLSNRLDATDAQPGQPSAGSPVELVGDRWFLRSVLDSARENLAALVAAHHVEHPLDVGAPRQDVRSRLGLDAPLFDQLVARLVEDGRLSAPGAELRVAGWGPALSGIQQSLAESLFVSIASGASEPPSLAELENKHGREVRSVLRHLEREQRLVQVEEGRFYESGAVRELLRKLEAGMAGRGELAPTELRDVLGFSRKYLIPFLEYCDRRGYTSRQGNGRVWIGAGPNIL